MLPNTQVNGADPADFFADMANGGEYYKEALIGIRDDVRGVQTEVAGLRSQLNQLGNQVGRMEAFELHDRMQKATARIETIEKKEARYEGQIQMLRNISAVATFISVLVGLILLFKGLK